SSMPPQRHTAAPGPAGYSVPQRTHRRPLTCSIMLLRSFREEAQSSSSSSRFSRATRTASTTKAEKVQSRPRMASSTASLMSLGKRMLLLVVGGILGILNLRVMHYISPYFYMTKRIAIFSLFDILQMKDKRSSN